MKTITRSEAIGQGLSQYHTGRPCKRGHFASRQVVNGVCMECHRLAQSLRNKEYHERTKDGGRTPAKRNKVCGTTYVTMEDVRAKSKDYRTRNPEKVKDQSHSHYERNKADYFIKTYVRRGILKQRLFDHELEAIRAIYRDCPEGHHVDHEIPINHSLVCGLHCVANLQYLTADDNLRKSNKWEPNW